MKNLKKVLSLALAFAMVLGLCIGASAQDVTGLQDWESVTHKDAAQLLNAFGIMQGDERGFRPTDNVTRAEAVKMINVALWGGSDLSARFTGTGMANFTDVAGNEWFAGHVNYAYAIGILAGYTDGSFKPQGNVTGYELLKMVLTALGYDQDAEGLVGAGWNFNAMALAMGSKTGKDLTAGVDIDWNAPISRDNAAQVIANMVERNTVSYDNNGKVTDGGKDAVTFGEYYLGFEKEIGVLVSNAYGKTTLDEKSTAVAPKDGNARVRLYNADGSLSTTYADVTLNSSLLDLGTNVNVYYSGQTLISAALMGWNAVAPAYNAVGDVTNMAENPFEVETGTKADGVYTDVATIDSNGDGVIDIVNTTYYGKPVPVKGVVETKTFGTVLQTEDTTWRSNYDREGYNIEARGFIKADGIDAEKGDYISVAKSTNANGASVNVGVVLTKLEGKVNRTAEVRKVMNYYIDGVAYTVTGTTTDEVKFGVEGTFYIYPDDTIGEFFAAKTADVAVNTALLYDAGYQGTAAGTGIGGGAGTFSITVAAVLPDGTKSTFNVSTITLDGHVYKLNNFNVVSGTMYDTDGENPVSGVFSTGNGSSHGALANLNNHDFTTGAANTGDVNYLVTYALDKDGNMQILSVNAFDTTIAASTTVKSGASTVKTEAGSKLIVPSTVTFIETTPNTNNTTEEWTVVTGSAAAYTTTNKVNVVLGKYLSAGDSIAYAVVEYGNVEHSTAAPSTFYYIVANNGQVDAWNGTPVYEVVVYNADTDKVETVETVTYAQPGTFYTSIDDSAFSGEFPAEGSTAHNGYVTSFANGIVGLTSFDGKKDEDDAFVASVEAFVTNSKTVFYFIDGENSEKLEANEVTAQNASEPVETKDGTVVTYQATVVTDKDGAVTCVILFADELEVAAE